MLLNYVDRILKVLVDVVIQGVLENTRNLKIHIEGHKVKFGQFQLSFLCFA